MKDHVADAIDRNFTSPNVADSNLEPANVVDAISHLASAVVKASKLLGNNDAATQMGALEAFGLVMKEGMHEIAVALDSIASAIENHGSD